MYDLVINVDILFLIKLDYFVIFLEFEEIKENNRGFGYWKLNMVLLVNEEYKKMINDKLFIWFEDVKDFKDWRLIWDWIKFNIRIEFIIFLKCLL